MPVRNCHFAGIDLQFLSVITLDYLGFPGTLPDISQLNARFTTVGFAIYGLPILGTCLWLGMLNADLNRNLATHEISSIRLLSYGTLSSLCGDGSLSALLSVLPLTPSASLI